MNFRYGFSLLTSYMQIFQNTDKKISSTSKICYGIKKCNKMEVEQPRRKDCARPWRMFLSNECLCSYSAARGLTFPPKIRLISCGPPLEQAGCVCCFHKRRDVECGWEQATFHEEKKMLWFTTNEVNWLRTGETLKEAVYDTFRQKEQ